MKAAQCVKFAMAFSFVVVATASYSQEKVWDRAAVKAAIEEVRTATKKYEDVEVAKAEGFIPADNGHCATATEAGLPAEAGAMGIHYINPKVLKITAVKPLVDGESTHTDFLKPAILLYEPQANGFLKLVGVENLVFWKAWTAAGNKTPPTFAGRTWDYMEGEKAHGFTPHADQHVYFIETADKDPMKQLLPFHPGVTCAHAK
jgi:hypothetical protein